MPVAAIFERATRTSSIVRSPNSSSRSPPIVLFCRPMILWPAPRRRWARSRPTIPASVARPTRIGFRRLHGKPQPAAPQAARHRAAGQPAFGAAEDGKVPQPADWAPVRQTWQIPRDRFRVGFRAPCGSSDSRRSQPRGTWAPSLPSPVRCASPRGTEGFPGACAQGAAPLVAVTTRGCAPGRQRRCCARRAGSRVANLRGGMLAWHRLGLPRRGSTPLTAPVAAYPCRSRAASLSWGRRTGGGIRGAELEGSRSPPTRDGGGIHGFSQQQAPGFLQADVLWYCRGSWPSGP